MIFIGCTNITEIIRKKTGGEAFAFTCPLMTKADGGKFGKTEEGNIWLDPQKTTPYQFYQFWLNAADSDAEKWIKVFTFLEPSTIDALLADHRQNLAQRVLQKELAKAVTVFVHGQEAYLKAVETTEKLFSNLQAPLEQLSLEAVENMEGVVKFNFDKQPFVEGIDIVSFLAATTILPSKSEARKLIQNGGISINRIKITDIALKLSPSLLLHNQYVLIQKGKKNYYLVRMV
jgi:tyrosyl-tRNA synthetase